MIFFEKVKFINAKWKLKCKYPGSIITRKYNSIEEHHNNWL